MPLSSTHKQILHTPPCPISTATYPSILYKLIAWYVHFRTDSPIINSHNTMTTVFWSHLNYRINPCFERKLERRLFWRWIWLVQLVKTAALRVGCSNSLPGNSTWLRGTVGPNSGLIESSFSLAHLNLAWRHQWPQCLSQTYVLFSVVTGVPTQCSKEVWIKNWTMDGKFGQALVVSHRMSP